MEVGGFHFTGSGKRDGLKRWNFLAGLTLE